MSLLSEARKRMFMRSGSIAEAEQEENDVPFFTRNNTNRTDILKVANKNESQIYSQRKAQSIRKKDYSPQFAKTDRWGQINCDDRYQSKSEKPHLIKLFGETKKARRGTVHSRYRQPISPTIYDVQFTQKDQSLYDDEGVGIREIKQTVHKQKLTLILSLLPKHRSFSPIKPKECLLQYTQSLIKEQKSKNQDFVDVMFPPKFGIIYNKKYMYLEEGLKFERLPKIYDRENICLIKFCQPTYLAPEKFTSYAVYSALAILAEEPTLVLNLFGHQEINHSGIYYVNLCKDGVWRYIVIDDFMPVKSSIRRTLMFLNSFPHNKMSEIWAPLVEKALAKLYGTYQDLYLTSNLGIKPIFTNLTGFPVNQYDINKDFRAFLVMIDTSLKRKHIVVLQGIKQQYLETALLKKIDTGLSYKVIEVKKNYIVIRNLNEKQINTKLTFEEAMVFKKLMIFRWEKNYTYMSQTLRHKNGYFSEVRFTVDSLTKGYWKVAQNSQVYYKNHIGSKIDYQQSTFFILLQKIRKDTDPENETEKQLCSTGTAIQPNKQLEIKPGEYRVNVHLCQKQQMNFTLVFYGEKQLQGFQRVKCNEKWNLECQCQIDSY